MTKEEAIKLAVDELRDTARVMLSVPPSRKAREEYELLTAAAEALEAIQEEDEAPDAVEYVRADEFERLKAEREAMERRARAFEAGGKKLQADRDALAAHVELLRQHIVNVENMPPLEWGIRGIVLINSSPATSLTGHPDDEAVDRFAHRMKLKLEAARKKGRNGWSDPDLCKADFLADLLVGHLGKDNDGNFEDIANIAMMLQQRGDPPSAVVKSINKLKYRWQAELLEEYRERLGYSGVTFVDSLADKLNQQAEGGE